MRGRRRALGSEFLESLLDLVIVAAADAGPFAGHADVLQFFGQGQHAKPGPLISLTNLLKGCSW